MNEVLKELLLLGGTSAISFFFAWLKKKADIKSVKSGKKKLEEL